MKTSDFFSKGQKAQILEAIKQAELDTSGEIRVHIESSCKDDVLDRAAYIFKKLKMYETANRNGVLFYLAINDKKFAVLGDAGINAKVPEGFWTIIKDNLSSHFKNGEFTQGLSSGILMAGEKLKTFFPLQPDDVNELSNDISFGN